MFIKRAGYWLLRKMDIEVSKKASDKFALELTDEEKTILRKVKPITMTSAGRLSGLALAMRYVNRNSIPGDIVECGVWAGGSIGAAALLGKQDKLNRKYWLFDTFEGMTRPSIHDPHTARQGYLKTVHEDGKGSSWCEVNADVVGANLTGIGVDVSKCRFVHGDVLETLDSAVLPSEIAVLRLDTDWYESTLKELQVLYPRLVAGGVLIIDDYGHWEGARKAVDQYFEEINLYPLLLPLDYTGRICVKLNQK